MEQSLYEITEELRLICSELEENGGELTDELAELLTINQNNLKEKLSNYRKAILHYNTIVECSKNEKKRLNDRQKVKENIINRLKSNILFAVKEFGYDGKSGNKIIELDDVTFYTKNTKAVNYDEDRVNLLVNSLFAYIYELNSESLLILGKEFDIQALINIINEQIKNTLENPEDFIPFTVQDLNCIEIEINTKKNLTEFISDENLAKTIIQINNCDIKPTYNKDILKTMLSLSEDDITIGYKSTSESLCMK